jgi:hypothetical protein
MGISGIQQNHAHIFVTYSLLLENKRHRQIISDAAIRHTEQIEYAQLRRIYLDLPIPSNFVAKMQHLNHGLTKNVDTACRFSAFTVVRYAWLKGNF